MKRINENGEYNMVKSPMKKDAYLKHFQERQEEYRRVQQDPLAGSMIPTDCVRRTVSIIFIFSIAPFIPSLGVFFGDI